MASRRSAPGVMRVEINMYHTTYNHLVILFCILYHTNYYMKWNSATKKKKKKKKV